MIRVSIHVSIHGPIASSDSVDTVVDCPVVVSDCESDDCESDCESDDCGSVCL